MKRSLLCVLLGGLLVASCGPHNDEPDVVWRGDLVELDGVAVSSGITLEIQKTDPKEGLDPFLYRLETGCTGAGFVDAEGGISAVEVLRPCVVADVEMLQRLNVMTSHAQRKGSTKARLRWDDLEASLGSSEGDARFLNAQQRGRSASVR